MNSIDENNSIYDMSPQGRVLNLKTTIPPTTYIYVATTALGVFFTDNYVNESVQPTWVDVSAGLATLDCKEFHVDPFDPRYKQYVLLATGWTLYRRVNDATWDVILTPTDCATLIGCTDNGQIGGFCLDPSIPGRMWATFGAAGLVWDPDGYWALYSDDYGDSWNVCPKLASGIQTHGLGSVAAYGDIVHVFCSLHAGAYAHDFYSIDKGVNWLSETISNGAYLGFNWNKLTPERVYYWSTYDGGGLHSFDYTRTPAIIAHNSLITLTGGVMWFDPIDVLHQRAIHNSVNFYYTSDEWLNNSTINPSPIAIMFSPLDIGSDIIVGTELNHSIHLHHIVSVMTNETDNAPVGIAGTNCDTAPFTDSIPDTCGGVCSYGVQAFIV
jgi:hypothetical protein